MKYIIIDWENHEYKTVKDENEVKEYFTLLASEVSSNNIDYFEELVEKHIVIDTETGKEVSFKAEPEVTLTVYFSLGEQYISYFKKGE